MASVPEPKPIDSGLFVSPLLEKWIKNNPTISEECKKKTLQLISERVNYGFKKYGQQLRTQDGRNSIEDARQEIGDCIQYLFKAFMNGEDAKDVLVVKKVLDALCEEIKSGKKLVC